MGTEIKQNRNRTTYIRCPKDANYPFTRVPAKLFELDGYQLAIMSQIISNKDDWSIVKYEIAKRVRFPRKKFDTAWSSLVESGYIKLKQIQGGYDYTIYDDLSSMHTTGGVREDSTSTTGAASCGWYTNYY